MSVVRTNNRYYSEIADAIRSKNKKNATYTPSEMASAIYDLEGEVVEGVMEAYPITVTPTGDTFTEYPDEGKGFSEVTVEGDPNLTPDNIVSGVSIYGVTGSAGSSSRYPVMDLPDEYKPYVDYCLENFYADDYATLVVWDVDDWIAVSFLLDNFTITHYNSVTSEIKATGWITCGYTKSTDKWTAHNYTMLESPGGNYAKYIVFASDVIMYNETILFPRGVDGAAANASGVVAKAVAFVVPVHTAETRIYLFTPTTSATGEYD